MFLMTNSTSLFANYPEADPNLRTEEAISTIVKNKYKSSVCSTSYLLQGQVVISITGRQGEKDRGKPETQ